MSQTMTSLPRGLTPIEEPAPTKLPRGLQPIQSTPMKLPRGLKPVSTESSAPSAPTPVNTPPPTEAPDLPKLDPQRAAFVQQTMQAGQPANIRIQQENIRRGQAGEAPLSEQEMQLEQARDRGAELGPVGHMAQAARRNIAELGASTVGLAAPEFAEGLRQNININAPLNPEYADSFWMTDVPGAIGSSIPFLAASALTGGGVAAPAALGVAAGGGGARVSAQERDATGVQELVSTLTGAGLGATEALPIARGLNRAAGRLAPRVVQRLLPRLTQRAGGRIAANAATQAAEEALQEFAQSAGQNAVDAATGLYREGFGEALREASRGAAAGAVAGGLTGGALSGAAEVGQRMQPTAGQPGAGTPTETARLRLGDAEAQVPISPETSQVQQPQAQTPETKLQEAIGEVIREEVAKATGGQQAATTASEGQQVQGVQQVGEAARTREAATQAETAPTGAIPTQLAPDTGSAPQAPAGQAEQSQARPPSGRQSTQAPTRRGTAPESQQTAPTRAESPDPAISGVEPSQPTQATPTETQTVPAVPSGVTPQAESPPSESAQAAPPEASPQSPATDSPSLASATRERQRGEAPTVQSQPSGTAPEQAAPAVPARPTGQSAPGEVQPARSGEVQGESPSPTSIPEGDGKQAHQMTKAEWAKANEKEIRHTPSGVWYRGSLYTKQGPHAAIVQQAINEGKPVPAKVLAEYPDLQKGATDAPPTGSGQPSGSTARTGEGIQPPTQEQNQPSATKAYEEREVPEGWYTHGREGSQKLSTKNVIQLTQSWDVADQYAGKRGSKWMIRPKANANILDTEDDAQVDAIVSAFRQDQNAGTLSPDLDEFAERASDDDIRSEISPNKIVSSAALWDDRDFAAWVFDRFGYDFVKTPDGAVVLNREAIEAQRVGDDQSAAQPPTQGATDAPQAQAPSEAVLREQQEATSENLDAHRFNITHVLTTGRSNREIDQQAFQRLVEAGLVDENTPMAQAWKAINRAPEQVLRDIAAIVSKSPEAGPSLAEFARRAPASERRSLPLSEQGRKEPQPPQAAEGQREQAETPSPRPTSPGAAPAQQEQAGKAASDPPPPPTTPPTESAAATEQPQPEQTHSARKADVKADRQRLGLDELPSPERRSWEEALDKAKQQDVTARTTRLVDEAIAGERAFNDIETAIVVTRKAQLENQLRDINERIADAEKQNDSAEARFAVAERQRLEDELDRVLTGLRRSGTEKGRALAAQKLTINERYELVNLIARARTVKGAPLTQAERARIEELSRKVESTEAELKKALDRIKELEANRHVARSKRRSRRSEAELDAELDTLLTKADQLLKAGCLN